MWENSSDNNTTEEMLNRFCAVLDRILFQKRNYFKIDGRPVFSDIFTVSLVNCSGGTEKLQKPQ